MTQAYILITCNPKVKPNLKNEITSIPEIEETKQVFGAYDFIAKTKDLSRSKIRNLVAHKIRPNKKIHSTLTLPQTKDEN